VEKRFILYVRYVTNAQISISKSLTTHRQAFRVAKSRWTSWVQFRLYSVFVLLLGVSRVVCGRSSPLVCAVCPAAAFAANAALVASQWQHCASILSLHPPINPEHEAGQSASQCFQVFGMAWPGIEPNQLWWRFLNQVYHSSPDRPIALIRCPNKPNSLKKFQTKTSWRSFRSLRSKQSGFWKFQTTFVFADTKKPKIKKAKIMLNWDVQGVSQLLKQSDWAQIQDFKWYHNDDYIYWKVKR